MNQNTVCFPIKNLIETQNINFINLYCIDIAYALFVSISIFSFITFSTIILLSSNSYLFKLGESALMPCFSLLIVKYVFISLNLLYSGKTVNLFGHFEVFLLQITLLTALMFIIDSVCICFFFNSFNSPIIKKTKYKGFSILTYFLTFFFLIQKAGYKIRQIYFDRKASKFQFRELIFFLIFFLFALLINKLMTILKKRKCASTINFCNNPNVITV